MANTKPPNARAGTPREPAPPPSPHIVAVPTGVIVGKG